MYQNLTLVGNLGSDPEARYTASGVMVSSFRMATSRSWTDASGERQEKVTWFRVTCWNKLAEIVTEHLKKGRQVLVVGEIEKAQAYVNKAGEMAATIEVTAQNVRFLGKPGDGGELAEETTYQKKTPASSSKGFDPDEDIPF